MVDFCSSKWEEIASERRGLVPDQTVEREVGDHAVEKEIRNARDLAVEVLKREKTKPARDQEKKKKKRRERGKDQQVAPQQVEHQQAEVVVVALLPEKRRKTINESEDLAAEAMKRERRKGLVVGREKEIRKEIERDAQEVAIVQLLLVHDQRVEVRTKKSLSQVETKENEMIRTAQIEARTPKNPQSQRKIPQAQVWRKKVLKMTRMQSRKDLMRRCRREEKG